MMRSAPLVIEPRRRLFSIDFTELWRFRELLYFLVWRDLKVRYKQTVLGALWAVIQPVFTMLVFSVFFGRLAGVPSDGVPYPLFAFAALVPWTFFANGLTQAAESAVSHSNLIKKVYFPRVLLPVAAVLTGFVDFAIASGVLLILMARFGYIPTRHVVAIPLLVLLSLVTALGVGLFLAALNVRFRDVRYTLSFLTQFWMLATPIAYPSSLLGEPWRTLYGLNPMAGVVEGFRWALLGTRPPPGPMLAVSATMALALLAFGAFFFRSSEDVFADLA